MERTLPIVEIAGTSFYMDVTREELRQADNAENRISFNELSECKEGYSLTYDTRTKNVPIEDSKDEPDSLVKVTLPALMELDPVGIAEKYGIPIEMLASGADMPVKVKAVVTILITKKK